MVTDLERKPKNYRTPIIVGAAALAVIVVLVILFVGSAERNRRETIELPGSAAQTQPAETSSAAQTQAEDDFAQVTTGNVQSILGSLERPDAYHQTLTVTTTAGDVSRAVTAEVWRSVHLLRAQLTDGTDTKNILTDGQTLYVWYNSDQTAASMALDESVTFDDLLGIPTYESLLTLPAAQIGEAEFVTMGDSSLECVYLSCGSDNLRQLWWVGLSSGLLYRETTVQGGEQIYDAQQTQLDILVSGDEAFNDVFLLPDGTDPFASASGK